MSREDGIRGLEVGLEVCADAVGDASFEGSDGFAVGLVFGEASLVVGVALGAGSADLGGGGGVDGLVDLAVASAVESVALNPAAAGLERGGAVVHSEAGLGGEAGGVAGLCEDVRGDEGSDAVDVGEAGSCVGDSSGDPCAERVDLAVEAPYLCDAAVAALGSPRSPLVVASRPRRLLGVPMRAWYPQRIFSRSACRRLMAAVRSMTSSRR